jgi:glutaredoxin 3
LFLFKATRALSRAIENSAVCFTSRFSDVSRAPCDVRACGTFFRHFSTRADTRIKMASELDSTLESADVVVFSYGGCPYCRKVTRGFDAEGIKYREVDYDDMDDGEAVRREIAARHKQRSVPAVFVKGKFVGGCNDGPESWMGALKLLSNGGLREMLGSKL